MSTIYLITGGAGNLACQLTFPLAARGQRVILADVAKQPVGAVAPGTEYVYCDVTDAAQIESLIATHRPEVVLHFASLLSAGTELDPVRGWQVNVDGGFHVLRVAAALGVRQVFFPSSVASYGAPLPIPVPEDYPQWPFGLYGVTKVAVERLGCYHYQRHGLDFRALRVPIVLSAFAHAGAASSYASLAFIESVARGRYTFRVRPQSRPSLVYIDDILRAILLLSDAPAERLSRRVYNIQALSPTAEQLAAAIRARIPKAVIDFQPDEELIRLVDSWPIEFSDDSARRDWNWRPEYDLDRTADAFLASLGRLSS